MTFPEFEVQLKRLVGRFTARHFDSEFSALLWNTVSDMSVHDFKRTVEFFMGNRKPTNPPLIPDFRDAVLTCEKREFNRDVEGAAKAVFEDDGKTPGERKAHVLGVLSREFGHVNSIAEAVQIARLRIRLGEE
ncbi:MAG: hypothetical protein EOP89_04835 [Lysobacteraceae bacterium]|nr:MAG: hypothetical protein EOP89_04835 [Xanthomonadaceae bacterium]